MEDNNNKNSNLEKFFKQRFNQKIEPEDWNIPDNEVWDNISAQLPTENKRRRSGILPLILLSSVLFLSSFMLGYDNYKKSNQITILENNIKECSEKISLIQNDAHNSDDVQNSDNSVQIIEPNTKTSIEKPSNVVNVFKSNTKTGPLPWNSESKNIETNLAKEFSVRKEESGTTPINDETLVSEPEPITKIDHTKLPVEVNDKKPSDISENLIEPEIIENQNHIKTDKSIRKQSAKLFFGPSIGYIFWQDKTEGSFESQLLTKEFTKPSISYGVAIGRILNKNWVFQSGLNYYERNHSSQYKINLPYSTIDEISVGLEYENRFQHSLPTGLGSINTDLVLSRSAGSMVQNNENVSLDFSLNNNVRALSLPISLSYYFTGFDRGFFVNAGLAHEWIILNKIENIETESHHPLVKDKSIKVDYNTAQIAKFNSSLIIGAGYKNKLFGDIDFMVSSQYGMALSNAYQSNNFSHKINQWNSQISVLKTW